MGIIKKQSIKGIVYLYIGVILGFITTGIIFPRVLQTEEVGLLRLLLSVTTILAQFAGLGFHAPTTRLFTYFRNKDKAHNGFLTLSLAVSLFGYLIFGLMVVLVKPWIIGHYGDKSALFVDYFFYLFPLTFFTLIFNTLDTYYKVLYNAVTGIILKDVWQRVFVLITVMAYYFRIIDFELMIALYVLSVSLPAILISISLFREGELSLRRVKGFITSDMAKTIANMCLFGILNGFSGILILNIDILMINHMLGLGNTGIYAVTMHFGTLVNIPARSIINIASVVIADAWKENKLSLIYEIYRKSSIILTTIGLFILTLVWSNIDNVFRIIGSDYQAGKYVILFISIAHLFGLATGVGKNIIINSKYYRYLTYFILIFAVIIVISNLIFIPRYGIVGAAFASAISKLLYNLIIWLFLWVKCSFQPFNYKYIIVIGITFLSYMMAHLLPLTTFLPLDILLRSSVVVVIFIPLTYLLKISADINQTLASIFTKAFVRSKL